MLSPGSSALLNEQPANGEAAALESLPEAASLTSAQDVALASLALAEPGLEGRCRVGHGAGSAIPSQDDAAAGRDDLDWIQQHEVSPNTLKNYTSQWGLFRRWAAANGVPCLPARATDVSAYLAERIEQHGHRPATLQAAAAAIAFVHRRTACQDPCSSDEVKRTLRAATRKLGRAQRQAEALTKEALSTIKRTACEPRPGRGGRLESRETARARGDFDIALISVMRDAMLRISEASALTWADIHAEPDGTGRLLIRRSKTDAEGRGAVAFVSAEAMAALSRIEDDRSDTDAVFALSPNQLSRRIKQAAQAAGLGSGFSGHSPRVGMTRDLVRAGIELPALMHAGRWRSPAMPAHYARNEIASNNAVARFYGATTG